VANPRVVLDDIQNQAANHHQGSMLLVAGAGSGKTATIVERAARLIEAGVDPQRMLMLTFSRKACREMYARLSERLTVHNVPPSVLPVIETYHSFGYKLLKKHPQACGRADIPSLMDEADAKKLFREAVKQFEIAGPASNDKLLRTVYEHTRNEGYDSTDSRHAQGIQELLEKHGLKSFVHQDVIRVFQHYEHAKREANVVDYSDLQVLPLVGLRQEPQWLSSLGRYFQDIVIDEAQDTNTSQYQLVSMIGRASPEPQVTMVGDDDQTIYGWRGARADNLLRFMRDFNPITVKLERNYRSPEAIVAPSTALIRNNKERVDKNPYSALQQNAQPVAYYGHPSGDLMADRIAQWLKRSIDQGMRPRDLAVLFRTNRMARVLEPALIARGVPYRIQQGFDLFSRQEVQMLMSCIRLASNPRDFMAFNKLSGMVKGFGDKRVQQIIQEYRCDPNCSNLFDKAAEVLGTKSAVSKSVADLGCRVLQLQNSDPLTDGLGSWALSPQGGDFGPWLKTLAKGSNNPAKNFESRLESLLQVDKAIKARMALVDMSHMTPMERWGAVMEIGLATPDEEEGHSDAVTLSTVHKMKGLEFSFVHIAGFSDGMMPTLRDSNFEADEGAQDVEEERRLAYVAMTRAKHKLVLHHANRVFMGYETIELTPSRFASEAGISLQMHELPTRLDIDLTRTIQPLSKALDDMGWTSADFDVYQNRNEDRLDIDGVTRDADEDGLGFRKDRVEHQGLLPGLS
jgi:DNA helicase-2/ATP-dependent DNA helicase PcrA